MKKIFYALLTTCNVWYIALGQVDSALLYSKTELMIPMRDGVNLFTEIIRPVNAKNKLPLLISRTPYGAKTNYPLSGTFTLDDWTYVANMAKEGYIFVLQDIRGKYQSEGRMQIHQPITHTKVRGTIDESTDTWDTIEWLIKNENNNNGKAGILGISYPGWLALAG